MSVIQCPVCDLYFELTKLRCGIVIHGFYTKSMKPINPHTDMSKIRGRTVGCLSRLKITVNDGGKYKIKVVDIGDSVDVGEIKKD